MKKIIKMQQDGFTLIEILMTVLIIVILAVVGITQFQNFSADAKNAATKSNLAILRNAIGVMNALERVRCQKTSALFPDVATINNNDITGCTVAGTAGTGTASACNPSALVDPLTSATYSTTTTCDVAFAGAAANNYMNLIPMVDHPFVQNKIPNNPWHGATATTAPNLVVADAYVALATRCTNAPVQPATIATICSTGGAMTVTNTGWCYCQATGQIWAHSVNNNGSGVAGTESLF